MKKLALALLACVVATNFCSAQQQYYDVTPGDGYGLRFWQDNQYKIHMGNSSEYHYGPVTDYSIKMNMSNTSGRGWTWGVVGSTPIAAINTLGNMQIAGSLTTPSLLVNVNPGGVGLTVSGNSSSNTTSDISISRTNSSGNVGNAPALQFNDTGSGSYNLIQGSSSGLQFYNLYAGSGWIERMRLSGSGNLGIGTISPGAKLDIAGSGGGTIDFRVNGRMQTGDSGGNGGVSLSNANNMFVGQNGTNVGFWTAAAGWNAFQITQGGNVGIGTVSPSQRMHISGSNAHLEVAARIENTDANNDSFAPIQFKTGSSPNVWQTFARNGDLFLGIANVADYMVIKNGGNVGIGTSAPGSYKLAVEGKIGAREVNVIATNPWPDYVFEKNYTLPTLESIKTYIDQNKHLPEVPSAKEVEKNGVNLGEMDALLLRKIEELTLHLIEQNKMIVELKEHSISPDPSGKKIEELTLYVIELKKEVQELKGNQQTKK